MTQPLSERTYLSALRMHQDNPSQIRKPELADFAHLDIAAAPTATPPPEQPAAPPAAPVDETAVQAALGRMQAHTGVQFGQQTAS